MTTNNELAECLPAGTLGDNSLDRTSHYRWIIFSILACGYVLVYFHRLAPAVVAVDMMTDLQAGGTLSVYSALPISTLMP